VELRTCPAQYVGLVSQVAGYQENDFPQRLPASDRPAGQAAVIMILESPHTNEFTGNPGPAKGRTGTRLREHLRDVLNAQQLNRHALILINAIQHQCSLGAPTKLYRDEMFRQTWRAFGENDFRQRLTDICRPEDFLVNACTRGKTNVPAEELRRMVEAVVLAVRPAGSDLRVNHPSTWHRSAARHFRW
jgi:hypothetical protein